MSEQTGVLAWLGVLLIAACGLLSALIETLLVPLYAGDVVIPIAVVLAVGLNIGLPLLARQVVPSVAAAAAPFIAWLIVVIEFGVMARPEGDVILPGAPKGAEYVTYAMLLLGAIAGAGTLVVAAQPRPLPGAASGPVPHQGRAGTKPSGGSTR